MNSRDLKVFLVLQFLAIVIAGVSFRLIENRLIAGATAGSYFLISGLYMISRAGRWPDRWRSLTIYPLLLHVFAISLPMMVSRFLQASAVFEDVRILGMAGPEFHKLSSRVFTLLVLFTIVDWIRVWRTRRLRVRLEKIS